ncbi:MAG: DEAD/DEAH box helicase family protein [Akkermansia sp.]|nr:DEAD/DEAH box helicase family protein [Akkermansia sp.]
MSKIRLHFEPNLEYQHRAIEAVCGLFEGTESGNHAFSVSLPVALKQGEQKLGLELSVHKNSTTLSGNELLRNLQAIQERNGIEMSGEVKPDGWHFTVEMETGTGKTYVYLRTIYELNKRYGFSKFVIVVPSIAIKEGVDKSISIMREHFRTLYDGLEMNSFTYDSARLQEVRNFGNSDKLQIMICTIQSITDIGKEAEEEFQDTAKRKGGKRAKRVMYTVSEKTDDRKPIEFIRECHPIVIIDEPQNIGSKGEEKGIACLHPLCTLRYSATHKNLFHPVYALNAVDASAQKLVKGIEVASIQSDITHVEPYIKLVSTSPKKGGSAKLEILCKTASGDYGREQVEVLPGTLLGIRANCPGVYDNVVVQEVHEDYIVCNHLESPLFVGQSTGGMDEEQITRAMIRATIEEHMKKEVKLRPKGIKVLSLFFIDQVADYRQYDAARNRKPGPLVQIFEQEYDKIMRMPQYRSLYEGGIPPAASKVHDGYFSIDKGKKGQDDIWTNTEDNAKGKEAAQRAYALIMRDKERLLSLDESLKFIFSHSALREGWDNPNVFQVCVLRDMSSIVSRRQALGRGLRLCVNQEGVRVRESGVNTLTVVAREDFKTYAAQLQKEYEADGVKFGIITKARLGVLEYTDNEGNTVRLGQELAEVVLDDLQSKKLITKEGKPTEELKKQLEAGTYKVPEACRCAQLQILSRLRQLTRPIEIKDARERQTVTSRYEKMRLDKDFLELWNRIKKKTTYRVQFDSEELISNVIGVLNIELAKIKAPLITKTVTETVMDINGIQSGAQKTTVTVMDTRQVPVGDILTTLEAATHLTRKTLSRILTGIQHLQAIRFNGPLFEKTVQRVIRAEMKKLMVKGVSYKPVTIGEKEYNAQELFKDTEGYLDKMIQASGKCVMDHVIWDSEIEKQFAIDAEASEQVKMYVKLPSTFRIHTPLGPYNPDWALVLDVEGKNHLYFVVETKGTDMLGELRDKESGKIHCAEQHFNTVADGQESPARYLAPVASLSEVLARV